MHLRCVVLHLNPNFRLVEVRTKQTQARAPLGVGWLPPMYIWGRGECQGCLIPLLTCFWDHTDDTVSNSLSSQLHCGAVVICFCKLGNKRTIPNLTVCATVIRRLLSTTQPTSRFADLQNLHKHVLAQLTALV